MRTTDHRDPRWLRAAAASGIGGRQNPPEPDSWAMVPGAGRFGGRPVGIVWLAFLAFPLAAAIGDHHAGVAHKVVVTVASVLFAGAYIVCWVGHRHEDVSYRFQRLAMVVVMVALVAFLVFYDRPTWDYELIFSLFPAMRLFDYKPFPLVVLVAIAVGLGLAGGLDGGDLLVVVLILVGVGTSMFGVTRAFEANETVARAEEDRAKVAVADERIRFARDLHDLLGHSLSVVTLKSELAGRLLPADPERAAVEVAEIERIARQALREVREAVSGYRRPTILVELAGARSALASAGIAWSEHVADLDLPPDVEAALAWSLREGVTNVIRHSGASRCTLTLRRVDGQAEVVVEDDGCDGGGPGGDTGGGAVQGDAGGNGLRGLHERVDLARGSLDVGPVPGGGWRLAATVPADTPVEPDLGQAAAAPAT